MTPTTPRLGEILERRGWLQRDQLLRALRHQKVVGGKLGLCLLEIDALSEEMLERALAEQQGIPAADYKQIRSIPPAVLQLVPARIAERLRAVPFWASKTQVHVALGDGRDLRALDELAFVTGRKVKPHVLSELRLAEALERHYAVECPSRLVRLLDRLNRQRFLWKEQEAADPAAPSSASVERTASGGPGHAPQESRSESGELAWLAPSPFKPSPSLDLPGVSEPPTAPPGPPSAGVQPPPVEKQVTLESEQQEELSDTQELGPAPARTQEPAPGPRAAAEPVEPAGLGQPKPEKSRDRVLAELLDRIAPRVRRVLLFRYRQGAVEGWAARGEGLSDGSVRELVFELSEASPFRQLSSGVPQLRGPAETILREEALAALLGKNEDAQVLLLPLRIRERLVGALLLEWSGRSGPAESDLLEEVRRAVTRASLELEMLVLEAKLRKI